MIFPVIMAGGAGTRFWPYSRRHKPKQLIRLLHDRSLIQQTVDRLQPEFPLESVMIVTHRDQAEEVRRQLPGLPPEQIIAEPCGRDTAACIGLAACRVRRRHPNAIMAVMAADHVIAPPEAFRNNLRDAARIADTHRALVAFGIPPTEPSNLYGYIRRGNRLSDANTAAKAFAVAAFTEKPSPEKAAAFLRTGEYYWNSGNFVWRAEDILAAMEKFLPELYAGLMRIESALGTPEQTRVLEAEYPLLPRSSIDYGVMEKAPNAVLLESSFDWDDLGSWTALPRHILPDADDNVVLGRFANRDTRDCIVASEGEHLVATIGVKDLIIVHTPDATLVCDRRRAAEIKEIVSLLKTKRYETHL